MAKMKIEVWRRAPAVGLTLRDRLVLSAALLPRSPGASPFSSTCQPQRALRRFWIRAGISALRDLPEWRRDMFVRPGGLRPADGPQVVLFADTFNGFDAEISTMRCA